MANIYKNLGLIEIRKHQPCRAPSIAGLTTSASLWLSKSGVADTTTTASGVDNDVQ
jgi:hypothetical protein